MAAPDWITNEFIKTHLQYTANTESPMLMHIWSAVSAASACMARHCWLDFKIGKIFPNTFVLLVGPPGTRKSQAINYSRKLLVNNTSVRFAPDDTGGQRQGLITAMEGDTESDDEADALLNSADAIDKAVEMMGDKPINLTPEDKHTMFICASEFGSFMGENSKDMVRFLIKMWDGEDYKYKLKTSRETLVNPLLTMIGGTTTTDISEILPPAAIGQGFMSRMILVFSAEKESRIARPSLDKSCIQPLKDLYSYLSYEIQGEIKESPEAAKLLDEFYMEDVCINDSRFMYYTERRHTHLIKLSMILAATDKRMIIIPDDVEQANLILAHTEETMPDALGEYGLSPLAAAKQKMVEFIQHAKAPVLSDMLWLIMQRDMKLIDYRNSLADLINAKKIIQVDAGGETAFMYGSVERADADLLAEICELDEASVGNIAL